MRIAAIASLILASLARPGAALGQPPPARVLRSAELLEDADALRRVYEAAHPGLYRYNTRAQMAGHFATLRAEFARDRPLPEAFVAVSQFLAKVRCGHTYANFVNQPPGTALALFSGRNRVPFGFRWVDGRMIVTRDLTGERRLAPGSEVLAIAGVEVPGIRSRLMTVARADGSNDAKRLADLEVLGAGRYEAFDVFLPLFYPQVGERIEVRVRPPSSPDPVTLTVAAHDAEQRRALARENGAPRRGESDPLWRFETLDDRAAYLRMPSWALYDSKWDWRGFLDRGVDDLIDRGVPGLIVDLRGNEGGQDVGNALIARVATGPVRGDGLRRYTRYRTWPLPSAFDPMLDTWDWTFKDWSKDAREDRDGYFRLTRFDDDAEGDVIEPRGRRYGGRVVVLIGAANSSATFQFARTLRENRLATLVGQATGGNRRGINGGAFFFVTLPHSKIEVDLPLVGFFRGDERPTGDRIPFADIPDAGVEPDVPVVPSVADIAQGVDTELRAARALLAAPR